MFARIRDPPISPMMHRNAGELIRRGNSVKVISINNKIAAVRASTDACFGGLDGVKQKQRHLLVACCLKSLVCWR